MAKVGVGTGWPAFQLRGVVAGELLGYRQALGRATLHVEPQLVPKSDRRIHANATCRSTVRIVNANMVLSCSERRTWEKGKTVASGCYAESRTGR